MLFELARRIGRAKGYADERWAHARLQWQRTLQRVLRVGLAWVALTLLFAAIRLWKQW